MIWCGFRWIVIVTWDDPRIRINSELEGCTFNVNELKEINVLVLGFHEDVFEEVVVMLLHLLIANVGQVGPVGWFSRVLWIDVQILKQRIFFIEMPNLIMKYERIKLTFFANKTSWILGKLQLSFLGLLELQHHFLGLFESTNTKLRINIPITTMSVILFRCELNVIQVNSDELNLQNNGLTECGLVVDPGAAIAVTAGPDLEVEGAIDFVLLGTENGSQVLGHGELLREQVLRRHKNVTVLKLDLF